MNRYENGRIYKIVDNAYTKCYVGSTCETLIKRFQRHKKDYQDYLDGRRFDNTTSCILFEEFGVENCKIELIENCPCNNKEELRRREGHYIQEMNCVNKRIAGRTKQEYNEYYKDRRREINKEYKQNNKDKYKQHKKNYVNNNREKVNEYHLSYYHRKKETLNDKIECPICLRHISKRNMRRHTLGKHTNSVVIPENEEHPQIDEGNRHSKREECKVKHYRQDECGLEH